MQSPNIAASPLLAQHAPKIEIIRAEPIPQSSDEAMAPKPERAKETSEGAAMEARSRVPDTATRMQQAQAIQTAVSSKSLAPAPTSAGAAASYRTATQALAA